MKKFIPILLSIVLLVSLCTAIGVSAENVQDSEVNISPAYTCNYCINHAYTGTCPMGCGGYVRHIGHEGDCPTTRCVSQCNLCTQKYYGTWVKHSH